MAAVKTTDETRYLDRIRAIAEDFVRGRRISVYLFGSRARGTARHRSDVDLAVDPHEPLPAGFMARLRDAYEESTIPWIVEVVNLSEATSEFRDRVLREGIRWIDSGNA